MRLCFIFLFLLCISPIWSQLDPGQFTYAYRASKAFEELESGLTELYNTQGDTAVIRELISKSDSASDNGHYYFWLGRATLPFHPDEAKKMLDYALFQYPDEPLFQVYLNLANENLKLPVSISYPELLSRDSNLVALNALIAREQLKNKEYDSAFLYWQQSDHIHQYPLIDEWIYLSECNRKRFTNRLELIAKIENGDLDNAERLVINDLRWSYDWWTLKKNPSFYEQDVQLLRKKLKGKREKELQLYLELHTGIEENYTAYLEGKLADWLKENLTKQELIIGQGELPISSAIAAELISWAISDSLIFPEVIYLNHSEELKKRERKGDYHAFRILTFLYAQIDGKIPQDMLLRGVEFYNDSIYAETYMIDRVEAAIAQQVKKMQGDSTSTENVLPADDPQLLSFLARYPGSLMLKSIRFTAAMIDARSSKKDPRPELRDYILTEFQSLQSDIGRHSFKLDALFQELDYLNKLIQQ